MGDGLFGVLLRTFHRRKKIIIKVSGFDPEAATCLSFSAALTQRRVFYPVRHSGSFPPTSVMRPSVAGVTAPCSLCAYSITTVLMSIDVL